MIKVLVNEYPDLVFDKDDSGWTPLRRARYYNHDNVVKWLTENLTVNCTTHTQEHQKLF